MISKQIFAVLVLGSISLGLRADVVVSFSGTTASTTGAESFTAYRFTTLSTGSRLTLGGFGLKTATASVSGSGNISLVKVSNNNTVGSVSLSGTITTDLFTAAFTQGNVELELGTQYEVIASTIGSFGSLAKAGAYSYGGSYGSYFTADLTNQATEDAGIALVTAVPEPGTMVLFGSTLLLGVGFVWIRNRNKALQVA